MSSVTKFGACWILHLHKDGGTFNYENRSDAERFDFFEGSLTPFVIRDLPLKMSESRSVIRICREFCWIAVWQSRYVQYKTESSSNGGTDCLGRSNFHLLPFKVHMIWCQTCTRPEFFSLLQLLQFLNMFPFNSSCSLIVWNLKFSQCSYSPRSCRHQVVTVDSSQSVILITATGGDV